MTAELQQSHGERYLCQNRVTEAIKEIQKIPGRNQLAEGALLR